MVASDSRKLRPAIFWTLRFLFYERFSGSHWPTSMGGEDEEICFNFCEVVRRVTKNFWEVPGRFTKDTWMSQEVRKWLVNGLYLIYL